jgi:hypothetical protein
VNQKLFHGSVRPCAQGVWIINCIFALSRYYWEVFSTICDSLWARLQCSVWKWRIFRSALSILPSQCQKLPTGLEEVSRLSLAAARLANQMFHGFCSTSVPPIDCDKFCTNFPLTVSFEARRKSDGNVRNGHISNVHHLNVPQVPDFSAAVSQYLLVNIKAPKESEDYRLTSPGPLLMASWRAAKLFDTQISSSQVDESSRR